MKVQFNGKINIYEYGQWRLLPFDKRSQEFVGPYHSNISFTKVFLKFKHDSVVRITIEEEKLK